MISDSEFIAIRAFDKTLHRAVDDAQGIINQKNAQLVAHGKRITAQAQRIASLEAALVAEQRKTAALAAQLQRFMAAMH